MADQLSLPLSELEALPLEVLVDLAELVRLLEARALAAALAAPLPPPGSRKLEALEAALRRHPEVGAREAIGRRARG